MRREARTTQDQDPAAGMSNITREVLNAYLDDALTEGETAHVEQALRTSEPLRRTLRGIIQERDRGEHSVGAIWRRQRLSCPPREQLGKGFGWFLPFRLLRGKGGKVYGR